jgi:hypothetical protein
MQIQTLPDLILQRIKNAVGEGPVKLHEPTFEGNESRYLQDCIESTYVSSVGKYVEQFEIELAKFTGAKHAISLVNGTAALHLALKLAGTMPGDEVLVQGFTFVATANAVTYCGATAHFVDIEGDNLGIDPNKLAEYLKEISNTSNGLTVNTKTGKTIKALIVMHTFGHPSKIDELNDMISELQDEIEEIESNPEGEFPQDLIDEKVEDLLSDVRSDPEHFMNEFGLEWEDYIDRDEFIEGVIDALC